MRRTTDTSTILGEINIIIQVQYGRCRISECEMKNLVTISTSRAQKTKVQYRAIAYHFCMLQLTSQICDICDAATVLPKSKLHLYDLLGKVN